MDKQKIITIGLAVVVIVALSYIFVGKYQESKTQEQITIYQQGAQEGYQQAIVQLVQQAATCQQVPITFQNQTLNMIAVECLKQG